MDVVLSNCVLNLVRQEDKGQLFTRDLPGGQARRPGGGERHRRRRGRPPGHAATTRSSGPGASAGRSGRICSSRPSPTPASTASKSSSATTTPWQTVGGDRVPLDDGPRLQAPGWPSPGTPAGGGLPRPLRSRWSTITGKTFPRGQRIAVSDQRFATLQQARRTPGCSPGSSPGSPCPRRTRRRSIPGCRKAIRSPVETKGEGYDTTQQGRLVLLLSALIES